MIFSTLNGSDTFAAYPASVRKALEWLRANDVCALPTGQAEIEGDDIFAKIMDVTGKPLAGSHPEVHKEYIDLFYWPEGSEKVGVAPFTGREAVYDPCPGEDVELLEDVENENILTVQPGAFALFFPWDAHRPGLMAGEAPETHRKCVIKIRMSAI